MSLCIANLQRFIKWSTFVRVLNPKQDLWASKPWVKFTINVYTFLQWFAALYHLEDLIVASKTVKNRIFLSSEGYLIVFFYLFTSWQDIFFSFRVSLTKWLFVFRNLLRPSSDLRDLWFHTHLQIRLADDTNSTSHTLKIIWSTFLLSIRCIAALAKSILFKDFLG